MDKDACSVEEARAGDKPVDDAAVLVLQAGLIHIYIYICMYVYIYIYIYMYIIVVVVTHGVFHTRLHGVCSDGRPESPQESLKRSDA